MGLRFFFILVCQLVIVTASSQPRKSKKIQRIIDAATAGRIPGVVIYIKTPGDGEWTSSSGLADVERSIAMDNSYVFATGSIGKMYNAVAAMKLVEQGKFQLDDKVSLYLSDEIVSNILNGNEITIRHLLGNTSGIYNYEFDPELNELYLSGKLKLDTLSHLNVLRRYVFGKPATNLPDDEYHYSSTNFMLLAMIMDKVWLEGHTDFLRKEIIDANGLTKRQ
jgi:D-alanyl-D-alanine carboxypeptidase